MGTSNQATFLPTPAIVELAVEVELVNSGRCSSQM